ncbi:phosphatidylethanolamine-binding protein [Amylocarpus encephaloides]|uniref:Phosphatidylethanolamine-binding protein n=1 Tax=Amylocarpus encephaloides TaxID=45428 RepID=A0A9P8C213_9HELO|nr:phosphatidylethanolamine-binding protein [Amylocarpus encephaloides]
MLFSGLLSLLVAGAALAQYTPPGFVPAVDTELVVKFGSKTITPGQSLGKADTGRMPILGTNDTALPGTYLFIFIDIDLPASFSNTGARGVVLHGMITGFKSSTMLKDGIYQLSTTATGPSSYFAPAPPAERPAWPHNYIQLLFLQPDGFKVPSNHQAAVNSRLNFNITAFMKDANLDAPVRANYFRQVNGA